MGIIYRPVVNGEDIIQWANSIGIVSLASADWLKVVITEEVEPVELYTNTVYVIPGLRGLEVKGKALVLTLVNLSLSIRRRELIALGASKEPTSFYITLAPQQLVPRTKAYNKTITLAPEVFL